MLWLDQSSFPLRWKPNQLRRVNSSTRAATESFSKSLRTCTEVWNTVMRTHFLVSTLSVITGFSVCHIFRNIWTRKLIYGFTFRPLPSHMSARKVTIEWEKKRKEKTTGSLLPTKCELYNQAKAPLGVMGIWDICRKKIWGYGILKEKITGIRGIWKRNMEILNGKFRDTGLYN